MFIARESELSKLDSLYNIDEFKSVYLHGEKHIGKSSLIREFTKDKDCLYFNAFDSAEIYNLKEFSKKVYLFFGLPTSTGKFDSWESLFNFIAKNAKRYKFVLVINNVTRIMTDKSEFQEVLALYIKNYFIDNKFMLILCCESDDFIKKFITENSQLWGLQSEQIKLEEFNFYDSIKLLGNMLKIILNEI